MTKHVFPDIAAFQKHLRKMVTENERRLRSAKNKFERELVLEWNTAVMDVARLLDNCTFNEVGTKHQEPKS